MSRFFLSKCKYDCICCFKFQGLPLVNLARFKEILSVISNLATKGSVLLGELPSWLSAVDAGIKVC